MWRYPGLALSIGIVACVVQADSVTLHPAADTTLFETYPDNNFGRFYLVAGTTAKQDARSRALIKFVPGTNLPPGAVISSVQLTVQVNRSPSRPQSSTFDLHRMLVDWAEGTGGSGTQARGSTPKSGESTWNMQHSPDTPWSTPGGAEGVEYDATISASLRVTTKMVFGSTPQLVADVQGWVDNPATNFGWILVTETEDLAGTARRFGSRETSPIPTLVVTFTASTPQNPPSITTQPQNQSVFGGETATFNVAATGSAPLTYRWMLNQGTLIGATNATLIVSNVQTTNAGTYQVVVTNPSGSTNSAPASLALLPPPQFQPVTWSAGVLNLAFTAQAAHNYTVQFSEALPAVSWQTLTNLPAPPSLIDILISEPTSGTQRFYRLQAAQAP